MPPTVGKCKRCEKQDRLLGGLCENCRLEIESRHSLDIAQERERASKEDVQREISERRRDKKFWLGK